LRNKRVGMVLNTYIWGDCTLFLNITMIILDKVFNFEHQKTV